MTGEPGTTEAVHRATPDGTPPPGTWRGRLAGLRLEIDSVALTLASGITAVLGLLYWAVAARSFVASEVGRGSAIISTATMLATLANMSLGGMYERFLPTSGRRAGTFLARGLAATVGLALLLGTGFLLLGPRDRLFHSAWEAASFPLMVATMAPFALLDQVLVGFKRATWAAGKNIVHAAAKPLLAGGLAFTASGFSLAVAWIGPALLLCVLYAVPIVRLLRSDPAYAAPGQLPPRRELWAYFSATYGIMVVGAIPPLVIPLMVLSQLGNEANAYFTAAWALFSALALLLGTVVGPYIAQASTPGTDQLALTRRFIVLLAAIGCGGAVFLWFLAPIVLGWIGTDYGLQTESLVRILALVLPVSAVGYLYGGMARVVRRLRLAVTMQVICSALLVGGAWFAIARFGTDGIAYTYLAVELLVTAVLLVPAVRLYRRLAG